MKDTKRGTKVIGFLDRYIYIIFPAPALLALLLILFFPLSYVLYLSFSEWFVSSVVPPKFIGLGNYIELLKDERFWHSLYITFYFTVLAVGTELVLGLFLALLLNKDFRGKSFVRTAFLLPMAATPVAVALVWAMMYNPTLGMINYFLETIKLPKLLWISDPQLAVPSVVLVDVWQWTPLVMLLILGGLQTIPLEILEAARIDGASGPSMFWLIYLPLLRPHIIIALIFRCILALKTYDIIYVMTQGGPGDATETLNIYVYLQGFHYFHMGYGASLAVTLLGIVLLVSAILYKVRQRTWTY